MLKNKIANNLAVIKNFGYLSILQVITILLPLLTYPYLIRVLGSEVYGVVVFAQAIIASFSLLVNFGFNISATKEVAENINNKEALSEIVSAVYILKFTLFFITFFLLLLIVFTVPSLYDIWLLLLLTFSAASYELLFPIWYFQGVDKMKYVTLLMIFARGIFTILIFVLVKESSDFLWVPILNGIGLISAGIYSIYILSKKEMIIFRKVKYGRLKYYFLSSLPLFISSASIQIYVNANRVLIGAFLGMSEVAFYDLGEKVLRLLKIPVGMLGQAAFPTLSRDKKIGKINKFMWLGVILTSILVLFVNIYSDSLVIIFAGKEMLEGTIIVRILSISAIMVAFSQFLGTSRLIVFGFKKLFTQIIASSGVFFAIGFLILYLTNLINMYSLAWLAVLVEVWVTLIMLLVNYKKGILYEKI